MSCQFDPVVRRFHCRLTRLCSLVAFLFLLLPGLVLAQVSGCASSEEADPKKERGLKEHANAMRTVPYWDDMIWEEYFRRTSEEHGLVHDRLRSDIPSGGVSVVKPVIHVSVNICNRTAAVMNAILSRIPGTNNCSEVASTQLAAITDTLDLDSRNISSLKSGDFDGLVSLTGLRLFGGVWITLPDGIFEDLTGLYLRNEDRNIFFLGLSLETNPGAPFRLFANADPDLTVQPGTTVPIPGSVTGPLTLVK